MSSKEFDIGGFRPFDVNSDPNSVGHDGFAVSSYMLTVKDLLLRLEKMTIRYSDEHFYFIVLGRMSRIFSMFCLRRRTQKNTIEKAEEALTRHFVTQVNVPYERHMFREMAQNENETIDQFAIRLRRKAQQCDYGDQMESQIRDQIISRCR